jgi:hypothetical protein
MPQNSGSWSVISGSNHLPGSKRGHAAPMGVSRGQELGRLGMVAAEMNCPRGSGQSSSITEMVAR